MHIHIGQVETVTFVERIQDEMVNPKTFAKIQWFLVKDIKISDIIHKIQDLNN